MFMESSEICRYFLQASVPRHEDKSWDTTDFKGEKRLICLLGKRWPTVSTVKEELILF
jgi:hypothetical protein